MVVRNARVAFCDELVNACIKMCLKNPEIESQYRYRRLNSNLRKNNGILTLEQRSHVRSP